MKGKIMNEALKPKLGLAQRINVTVGVGESSVTLILLFLFSCTVDSMYFAVLRQPRPREVQQMKRPQQSHIFVKCNTASAAWCQACGRTNQHLHLLKVGLLILTSNQTPFYRCRLTTQQYRTVQKA